MDVLCDAPPKGLSCTKQISEPETMKSSISMCNVHEEFHEDKSEVSNNSNSNSDLDKHYGDRDDAASDSDSHKELRIHSDDEEDGEISVGCPSPVHETYFKDDVISISGSLNGGRTTDGLEMRGERAKSFASDEEERSSRSSSALTCRRRYSLEDSEDNAMEDYNSNNEDSYFTPLKKLKMMQIDKMKYGISEKQTIQKMIRPNKLAHSFVDIPNELTTRPSETTIATSNFDDTAVEDLSSKSSNQNGGGGVKSFSILDILNHHPKNQTAKDKKASSTKEEAVTKAQPTRIVRPWDIEDPASSSASSFNLAPPPAHCGAFGLTSPMLMDPRYHPRLHLTARSDIRPKSADFCSAYESCSSGRSSAGGSDYCTSPDIINATSPNSGSSSIHQTTPRRSSGQQPSSATGSRKHHQSSSHSNENKSECSPLELLVEMTAKPFDKIKAEQQDQANPLNLFNSRQQAKKKRKSRTAFTNVQIMELERRFIHQKYLSPADRDEIAFQLRLTNAQVITWFQNRRAKLKRDMEERAKDVRATEVLTGHSAFFENAQNIALLKKKPVVNKEID